VIVQAIGGPCGGLFATASVPNDWPEQQVKIVDEEVSANVKSVRYRTLPSGVKQMLVTIPRIEAGGTATALITFEITKSAMLPPVAPQDLILPKRLPRTVQRFLGVSPKIESRHAKIRAAAKQATKDKETAWEQVEAIYDWVRDNVNHQDGKLKGALAALRDKTGAHEDLTSLFVAMCRAHRVPARTVWVLDHTYAEFYLQDEKKKGNWYPCEVAGAREFGKMSDFRPILQKGDNIKVPEKREPQRYVAEFLKGTGGRGVRPRVQFVRQTEAVQ
jgi:transglutaminase-like putative cysteine protease